MTKKIKEKAVINWISGAPVSEAKFALLIPQYNESSNSDMDKRLMYFNKVATKYKDVIDVILIDDGSTDNSLVKILQYYNENIARFYLASVRPNAKKVGALHLVAQNIANEFVILSDFDTDIDDPGKVLKMIEEMQGNDSLMGCYFRMMPYEGDGHVFYFQQLEYSLIRSLYQFHVKERTVLVMPGAGCCYKRKILLSIYQEHSGLHSGEDREATQIGHRLGYKALYASHIRTLTRPPLSLKALIKQRVRWNLGYLETFDKEKKYYFQQISKFSRVGIRALFDGVILFFLCMFPFLVFSLAIVNVTYLIVLLLTTYCLCLVWCLNLMLIAPGETNELKGKRLSLILRYPFMKLTVDYLSWMGALLKMFKNKRAMSAGL
ncbi:glycosyltransferase [Mucilaginibacter sp. E4BP6]|uniref:glycosyltransferase n=1 Tax=Mucilaginibacter sp. E4BP6 TaxID=2723089 RepID=UPI0015C779D8|nr:glycosyltransferase family 2 protein [Mucilaginibacter sp. E4BP6]NYE68400.1 cellulose synthase/poly-beta-1,6-N-acetylglucosamine synthase-like glycosyltransferase [Mucilaginibacter sp. E4BP6]